TSARQTAVGLVGRLTVGFNTPSGYALVPRILRVFRERRPNVEFDLREMETSLQVEAIAEGRMDVGFIRSIAVDDNEIVIEPLLGDRVVAVLPEGHRLGKFPKISLRDLRDEPFILPPDNINSGFLGRTFYEQILRLCHEAGFTPKVVQLADRIQTAISLVAAGIGVTLVTASFRYWRRDGVVYTDLRGRSPLLRLELGVAWSKRNQSPILPDFIDVTKQVSKGMADR
ncbi:MAG: LysR family substrate-binding domain-containing protein, partial [Chloroflexota bacterium]